MVPKLLNIVIVIYNVTVFCKNIYFNNLCLKVQLQHYLLYNLSFDVYVYCQEIITKRKYIYF